MPSSLIFGLGRERGTQLSNSVYTMAIFFSLSFPLYPPDPYSPPFCQISSLLPFYLRYCRGVYRRDFWSINIEWFKNFILYHYTKFLDGLMCFLLLIYQKFEISLFFLFLIRYTISLLIYL